jgi:uncharacterized protein
MALIPSERSTALAVPAVGQIAPERRWVGPDVVRAIALIGVAVMNYHGYLVLRGDDRGGGAVERFFDPWTGPLSTRFAATFVLVAGVGVTLISRSSMHDPAALTEMRWRLVRRGLVLYVAGIGFDMIWPGTILPFYGAMFAVAGLIVAWRSRWILLVGLVAAVAGAGIHWWRTQRGLDGESTSWIERGSGSPRAALLDVFVNGTHPLLPWLAFFCAGIVLARLVGTAWWRPAAMATGFVLFTLASLVSSASVAEAPRDGLAGTLASTDPFDRGLLYTASALGTALIAFAGISWLAEQFAGTGPVHVLQVAGQMTLTLYIAHGLVFNLLVDWWGWVDPSGIGTALTFAAAFWIAGIGFAWLWSRDHRRGPLEVVYRHLTESRASASAASCGELCHSPNVLHCEASPVEKPRRNHVWRCSLLPWVHDSRSMRPCDCCWMRSSPTAAAALSASSISPGSSRLRALASCAQTPARQSACNSRATEYWFAWPGFCCCARATSLLMPNTFCTWWPYSWATMY